MSHFVTDSLDIASRMAIVRAKRLVALPLTFASTLRALAREHLDHPFEGFSPDALNAQIKIFKDRTEYKDLDALLKRVIEHADRNEWLEICQIYRRAEETLSHTPWGQRHYTAIIDAVTEWVMPEKSDHGSPYDRVAWIEAALDENPTEFPLAIMAAIAHVKLGWAYRGTGWAEDVSQEGWERLAFHSNTASDILSRFDPGELASPGLAQAYHTSGRGEPDHSLLTKSYRRWVELDPLAAEAHQVAAYFTLPRWGGSHFEVELLAKHVWRTTASALGRGGYALVYLGVLEDEPDLSDIADAKTFHQGVLDLLRVYPSQTLVNQLLSCVMGVLDAHSNEQAQEPEVIKWKKMLSELMTTIVTEHLTTMVPQCWNDDLGPLPAIAAVFREQFDAGATISLQAGSAPLVHFPGEV